MAGADPVITWPGRKEEYELEDVIGEGATAVVQTATCKSLRQRVAIKRINLENCSAGIDEIQKEIQAMYHCRHPNVVTYYTSFVVREELWLVMKLLGCGSVLDIIKHQKSKGAINGIFDESIVVTILFEALKGLEYFHSQGQMHRDLKAGNILVGEDGSIQIADFGVSAGLFEFGDRRKKMRRNTFVGTPCWMAPEVMDQSVGYDSKADMWSYGILALELATGTAPYAKFPPMKILMLTMQEEPPTLETCEELHKQDFSKYSKAFRRMAECCLKKDPQQRLTAAVLLKNPFFKKSKGSDFLCEKLVPLAPSFKSRAKTVRRVPGASGRLHRTEDGGWEWSDEECDAGDGSVSTRESSTGLTATNAAAAAAATASTNARPAVIVEALPAATVNVPQRNQAPPAPAASPTGNGSRRESNTVAGNGATGGVASVGSPSAASPTNAVRQANTSPASSTSTAICLALRLRNAEGMLKDIKFEFHAGKDTPTGIARELVSAGLIHDLNTDAVGNGIQRMHTSPPESKKLTFELPYWKSAQAKDEKTLHGFGQLSIT